MALHPKVKYNPGEGLTSEDLNESQSLLSVEAAEAMSVVSGARLGAVHDMSHTSASQGADAFHTSGVKRGEALDADKLYTPAPISGIISIDDGENPTAMLLEHGILVQRRTASTPGTAPAGIPSLDTPIVMGLEASVRDLVADYAANAPPGSGDPRWDTHGVQLKYEQGSSESRDFKDATTGAQSTSTVDKEERIGINTEFVTGAQAATFDMATLTAGFVPLLTKRRAVSESSPYNPEDFYYHPYPLRLGVETVYAQDGIHNHTIVASQTDFYGPSGFQSGVLDVFGSPAFPSDYFAVPRTMHSGCRLVGISWQNPNNGPTGGQIVRLDNPGVSMTYTTLFDFTATDPFYFSIGIAGMRMLSEQDWSPSGKPLPIWGNGYTAGPLVSTIRKSLAMVGPGTAPNEGTLAVRFNINGAGTHRVGPVKFYYLH